MAPGFVDIHTHYDGQATWDPFVTPSSWHGVTTTVFGNCGVGFAPVRPGKSAYLINLMEGVEDIPGTVLSEGVKFDWESFPQYLDALESMRRAVDVAAQLPHGALRFYVMGERGANHEEVPDEREIEQMARLTEQALRAGAMGFTTSRTTKHKAKDGRFTPSLSAREIRAFRHRHRHEARRSRRAAGQFRFRAGRVRGAAGRGGAGRPAAVLPAGAGRRRAQTVARDARPDPRRAPGRSRRQRAGGLAADRRHHGAGDHRPSLRRPSGLARDAQALARPAPCPTRRDPELRRRLVETPADGGSRAFMAQSFHKMFPVGERPDYEPDAENSVAAIAQRTGRTPQAVALEEMMAREGKGLLMLPFENYAYGSLDVVHEMITDPATVLGVADGGAHVGVICDASSPTSLLTLWGRDRTRGPRLPLEFLVAKQTRGTAAAYGLLDRGLLAPGHKADINVIDFDALSLKRPEVVYDLPAGGRRLIQRASGYRHTFNAGVETVHNDELTGERPGRLVRGAQVAG